MNIIVYICLFSLFMLPLPEMMVYITGWAADFITYTYDNKSPLSLNLDNRMNETLILYGATLIDVTSTKPKTDSVILINGDKILAVTNRSAFNDYISDYDNGSQTIERVLLLNLTGKYIIPGLFDMHAHVAGVLKNSYDHVISENTLGMLLDHGITTIRSPGGPTNESVSLKEEVFKGTIKGPEIFTAGRLLNSPELPVPFVEKQVTSEEEIR